ncbi:hypothetical protein [uncultured Bacteroides sp.]|uniref:hypothetical protein n=1 Tax=uncultured Bacteroides sp. TaxID=162156 RepID=UPI002AAB10A7|nr:hypothetical protein [uncultured Bacteroides sp.]
MKKEKWALGLSIVAIILSIIALSISFIRCESITVDFISLLISVATLAITVYVGIQIYQSFTLKKDIDKMQTEHSERLKEETRKIVEDKILDYDHTVSASISQVYAISTFLNRNDFKGALHWLIISLEEINKASDKTPLNGIISYIKYIKDENTRNSLYITLTNEEKQQYISEISKAQHGNSVELIEFIASLEVVSE